MGRKKTPEADIALLLEGTYPYVRGGVSGWVYELISGLPEYSFSLVFLGATKDSVGAIRYELPDNVVSLSSHYLMEPWDLKPGRWRRGNAHCFADAYALHESFRAADAGFDEKVLGRVLGCLGKNGQLGPKDFFFSEASWDSICNSYTKFAAGASFIDYFWTVRNMHSALFKLADIAHEVAPARAFHTVSTGYAGFLGALFHNLTGRPLIVTEHGIYTKERKIDLQAAYIQDSRNILA
ncbi:MAG: GT4 family glycosyltransferase PelF, partial [Gammaproteobacteria bacterium]